MFHQYPGCWRGGSCGQVEFCSESHSLVRSYGLSEGPAYAREIKPAPGYAAGRQQTVGEDNMHISFVLCFNPLHKAAAALAQHAANHYGRTPSAIWLAAKRSRSTVWLANLLRSTSGQ